MPPTDFEILYADNHLLAVNKPPGLPTMGVAPGAASLFQLAKEYIKQRYHKPGGVYVGIVSRLDAAASGVVLLARTSKAAARLSAAFAAGDVEKIYWALVSGAPQPPTAQLVDWVAKDDARRRMAVRGPNSPGAKQAVLRYRPLRAVGRGALVEIELVTGRKHQIRLQLGCRGLSVWGERKYGTGFPFAPGIALHARQLTLEHPVRREPLKLVAPLPPAWHALGIREEE